MVPFVKWAGGKRQLLDRISDRLPKHFNRYFEPFVGGGAVLFELHPEQAVINDINTSLINAYKVVRDYPDEFIRCVNQYDAGIKDNIDEYYYEMRQRYNDMLMREEYDEKMAALFVFINKHCFNGLYRVNGNGLFNVPCNHSNGTSLDADNIHCVSGYLQNVTILNGDFEVACVNAQAGDFIFFDSPYAPLNPTSFESYTKEGFSVEDHKRLADLYAELTNRGCYCMLTNHNTDFINTLYGNKGYTIEEVDVKRFINSDASNRKGKEVIIRNY